MNVGTIGTSIPTYVKNASAAAVTAMNGFDTRRDGGTPAMLEATAPETRDQRHFATEFTSTAARRSLCVTAYVVDDVCGDTEQALAGPP